MRGGRLREIARALRAIVAEPNLRRAEISFALTVTSETAFTVALGIVAFRDGGAGAVGLVALLRMLPSAIGSPLISAYADQMRRERVLIALSLVRAAAVGGAALLLEAGTGGAPIYALAVVATVAITVFRPAHSALLPLLCKETSELTSANVVRGMLEGAATLVGPAIAGILLATADAGAAFVAVAIISVLSALPLLRVRYDHAPPAAPIHRPQLRHQAAEGLHAVLGDRDLRTIFGLGFAQTFVRGALNVFTVVMALELLETGESGVAALSAAVGAGGIIGAIAVTFLIGSRHLGMWLAVALVLWGTPIAVVGAVPNKLLAFGLLAVVGLANAFIDIPLFSLPVRFAADAVLARAFGVFESMVALGVGLGSLVSPALIDLIGLRPAIVAVGLLLPTLAVVTWRRLTELDRRLAGRDEEIAVLRGTPMLALLPIPTIEHLARRLRRRTFAPSTVLFEQGEAGNSFFVSTEGYADVIGDGVFIRTMGPGEGFGEIALMHDVPRTVTVRARSRLTVFELERDDFLDAVSAHRASADATHAVMAGHLANYRPLSVGV